MTEKERKQLYAQRTPEAPLCANCKHFYQHYTQSGVEVQCGHCAYPRGQDPDALRRLRAIPTEGGGPRCPERSLTTACPTPARLRSW